MAVLTLSSAELDKFPEVAIRFATFKSGIQGCSEKTVCEYLSDLRTFFRFYLATQNGINPQSEAFREIDIRAVTFDTLRRITTEDIYRFLLYTKNARGNEWAARSRKVTTLRVFFGYYCKKSPPEYRLDKNPAADVEPPRKRATLPKHLTLGESISLLDAIQSDTASRNMARDYAIVTIFLNCGIRLSELVGIDINDIDRDFRSIRVTGKGNKQRVLYINDACRTALQNYLKVRNADPHHDELPALFLSNRNQRISNKTVQWIVYKYLRAAGLDLQGYSVHKLRHTAATLMYQTGAVDVRVLKEILGHAQLNTTQIYTHVTDSNMETAIETNPLAHIHPKKNDK